jgi:hypothetical protein
MFQPKLTFSLPHKLTYVFPISLAHLSLSLSSPLKEMKRKGKPNAVELKFIDGLLAQELVNLEGDSNSIRQGITFPKPNSTNRKPKP